MYERSQVIEQKGDTKKGSSALKLQNTEFFPSTSTPADRILSLQRTLGNQAVQRLFKTGTIQVKLNIGQPNDIYEQEADRVANQVMSMPEPHVERQPFKEEEEIKLKPLAAQITPLVQRQIEEPEGEKPIQTKQTDRTTPTISSGLEANIHSLIGGGQSSEVQRKGFSTQPPDVSLDIESRIQSPRYGGCLLPDATRRSMEHQFGADFGHVRLHADSDAYRIAAVLGARAFTSGSHIWFGKGVSTTDRRLLAHELTHVVQQSMLFSASVTHPQPSLIQRCEACIDRELYSMADPEQAPTLGERRRRLITLERRRDRLRRAFRHAMTLPEMEGLYDRLVTRPEGDSLVDRFYRVLHTATQCEMLSILSGRIAENRLRLQNMEALQIRIATQQSAAQRWYRNTQVLADAVDSINRNPGAYLRLLAEYWLEREAELRELGVAGLLRGSPWPRAYEAINNPPTPLPESVHIMDVLRAMAEDISAIVLRHELLDMEEFQDLIREGPSEGTPTEEQTPSRPERLPVIPLASTFVQRDPDGEHILIENFIGEHEDRPEFEYFTGLPRSLAFYPGSDNSCQDDYIYYDPNQGYEGRTSSLYRPELRYYDPSHPELIRQGRTEDNEQNLYVVYYHRDYLFIVLGPGALSNLPHSLSATLSHELIHLRQKKAVRQFRREIAGTNMRALLANDPTEIPVSIREANVRFRGVSRREAGVDLLTKSNCELQAHATVFAHFFGIHIESARNQLVPLCFHHYEVTPEWSYDWATPDGREYALRVAVDAIMTGGNRATFDRDVLPYLGEATVSPPATARPSRPPSSGASTETSPEESAEAGGQGDGRSRFLSDLVDRIRRRSSTGSAP